MKVYVPFCLFANHNFENMYDPSIESMPLEELRALQNSRLSTLAKRLYETGKIEVKEFQESKEFFELGLRYDTTSARHESIADGYI